MSANLVLLQIGLFFELLCPLMFSDSICCLEVALLFVHVSNKRGLIKGTVHNDSVLLRMSDVQDWTLPVKSLS